MFSFVFYGYQPYNAAMSKPVSEYDYNKLLQLAAAPNDNLREAVACITSGRLEDASEQFRLANEKQTRYVRFFEQINARLQSA